MPMGHLTRNPDYEKTQTALNASLARYGLAQWVNKLPPEFIMAAVEAVKRLVEENKDNS